MNNAVSVKEALGILGERNCVMSAEASWAWQLPTPAESEVPYTRDVLEKASMDVIMGKKYWILVWIHGLSLIEQFKILGPKKNKQPCFYEWNPIFCKHNFEWAFRKARPDYYLLNVQADINDLDHEETEKRVQELGPDLVWCEEGIFSEAVLTYYMCTGIRIFEHYYHRGMNIFEGRSVIVGHFGINGLDINGYSSAHHARDIKTVLYRKQLEPVENQE